MQLQATNVSYGKGSPMQGNEKNWRFARLLVRSSAIAASGILTCAPVLGTLLILGAMLGEGLPGPIRSNSRVQNGTAIAQTTVQPAPADTPSAEAAPTALSATQQQRQTEDALNRAETLFAVMIGALILLLGTGMAMLWALRKSVVNEVATVVRTQLNEMTELENRVHNATRSLNRVLADTDDMAGELEGRSNSFQREIVAQREVLYNLVEELNAFKVQTAKNWEKQLEGLNDKLEATATDFAQTTAAVQAQAKQRLEDMQTETAVEGQRILQRFTTSEAEFSRHVGVIKEETQRRKSAFFDEVDRKESVLSDQLGSLQAETVAEQDRVLASLSKLGNEFGPKLSDVEAEARTKIEQQRDQVLDNLQTSAEAAVKELEDVQASALGHRELALQNIQRSTEELQQQFNAIRNEVESRKADMM
ncbi:MAG: hypothetical protein AAF171_13770, partial [Cyanobacteria bacterium P01_A01_bin.116]